MKNLAIKLIVGLIAAFILGGCATHQTPMEAKEKFIFVTTDEESVINAAYNAMLEAKIGSPIVPLAGPVKGFSLTQNWAADYWTTNIKVFPAKGKTLSGEMVHGYYPDVSGGGTLAIRGPARDKRIYEAAIYEFSKIAKKQIVTRIERGAYIGTDKQKGDVSTRLQNIEKLYKEGTISKEEYTKARDKILKDL